jgi:hypothetical protein
MAHSLNRLPDEGTRNPKIYPAALGFSGSVSVGLAHLVKCALHLSRWYVTGGHSTC